MKPMNKIFKVIFLHVVLFISLQTWASPPKVGLALGGGGAKGAATIGALKVVEKAGIKVDYIAGTSIGAIIGGLYASGYTVSEMETLFLSQDWQDILEGHRIDAKLNKLLADHNVSTFQDTSIPFRCVAADQKTMEEVVLSSGSLPIAIRASMSIPKFYEPVKWGNVYLIDGGVINNLPVDVVKDMGADIVIAIDLEQGRSYSLAGFSFKIGGLADWFLARPDIPKRMENIKVADVHIHPRLPDFTAMSFGHDNCELMMQLGEKEANDHWDELIEIKNRQ